MTTNKYSQSYVYRIFKIGDESKCYVGSSVKPFNSRINSHTYDSKRYPERNLYIKIVENGGWDNFFFEIIEHVSCNILRDLRKVEQKWIDELKPEFNTKVSYTGLDFNGDYNQYSKDYSKTDLRKNNCRKYYINNKEKINTRNEEYKQKHKEYLAGKAKENHEKNKDKIKETQKAYYQENNFYVKCECVANVQKISMTRHLKLQKHIKATDKI